MVTPPSQPRFEAPPPARPLLVELVGPAGAGKTAVFRAIGSLSAAVETGVRMNRRRFTWQILGQTPALVRPALELFRADPRSLWSGLRHLTRLAVFPSILAEALTTSSARRAVVLDEGPVFSLARLSVYQDASRGNGRLAEGWQAELVRWSDQLDLIVWLDASNGVLAERIRHRAKAHHVKSASDSEVFSFLDRYRRAYLGILERMKDVGRVQVLEIPSASRSAASVAREVVKVVTANAL